jgi:hypothetical protein
MPQQAPAVRTPATHRAAKEYRSPGSSRRPRALAIARKKVLDEGATLQREKADAEAALAAREHQGDLERLRDVSSSGAIPHLRQCEALGALQGFPLVGQPGSGRQVGSPPLRLAVEKSQSQHGPSNETGRRAGSRKRSPSVQRVPTTRATLINPATLHQLTQRIDKATRWSAQPKIAWTGSSNWPICRLQPPPRAVEWLATSSFAVALRARDEECAARHPAWGCTSPGRQRTTTPLSPVPIFGCRNTVQVRLTASEASTPATFIRFKAPTRK